MISSTRWAFNFSKWEPTEKELLLATSCIQKEEKTRLAKFMFKKDFKASLVGRLLMRKFVSNHTKTPYNKVYLKRDSNEKPIFECINLDEKPVSFNVSHQGSYTVLAGETETLNLGIDVMKLEYSGGKKTKDFFKLMNSQFTENEWRIINGSSSDSDYNKISRFCRNWALKESYVKAIGIGISIDLKTIEFRIQSPVQKNKIVQDTSVHVNNEKQNFLFEESLIDSDHVVAVALENRGTYSSNILNKLIFKILSPSELLENVTPLLPEDKEYCDKYFLKNEHP